METIFDKATRDQLIARINNLSRDSTPQWGKMNITQMLKHCIIADEMYLGKKQYKRVWLGRVLGKWALNNMLKDESPMQHNAPTSPHFKVLETGGDVEAEKKKWIAVLEQYANFNHDSLMHWFFGTMTKEQVGQFAFKHTDHHLRQFNC